jgi:hypothetical protein
MRPRRWICARCRLLLEERERCDNDPRHPTLALDDPKAREELQDQVWVSTIERDVPTKNAIDRLGAWGVMGSMIGGFAMALVLIAHFADSPALLSRLDGWPIQLVVWTTAAFFAVAGSLTARRFTPKRKVEQMLPAPAIVGAPLVSAAPPLGLPGRIEHARPIQAPWGQSVAGFGIALIHSRALGGPVTLRDAACGELRVRLDDGRLVRVPPGRVRLEPSQPLEGHPERDQALRIYVATLVTEAPRCFPHDQVLAIALTEGDRVRVGCPLLPSVESDANRMYRDAPDAVLLPATPCVLQKAA